MLSDLKKTLQFGGGDKCMTESQNEVYSMNKPISYASKDVIIALIVHFCRLCSFDMFA